MALITVDKNFTPDAVAQLVVGGFANVPFLAGSGAVDYNPTMVYGSEMMGKKILVPYTTLPEEWGKFADGADADSEDIQIGSADGATTDPEEAFVDRISKGMEMTWWARQNPFDPAGTLRDFILKGWGQTIDTYLIKAGADITIGPWAKQAPLQPGDQPPIGKYTIDVSAIPDPDGVSKYDGMLSHESVIMAKSVTGAEGWNSDFVFGVVHSHTISTMYSRRFKDGGKPGYLMSDTGQRIGDAKIYRMDPLGTPILVTDKMPVIKAAGQPDLYVSSFYKRKSIALYQNPTLSYQTLPVPKKDAEMTYWHNYFAIHRFFRLNGNAYAGVVNVVHK